VLDTAISPDGSKVVFTTGRREILVLDVATGKISPLAANTPDTVMAHHPSWSPDGARLVFRRNGTLSIFDLNSKATQDIGKVRHPAWSPTGEWIAYFDDSSQKCLLIRPDGTGGRTVKSIGGFSLPFLTSRIRFTDSPVWSPDGRKLLLNIFAGETWGLAEINEVVLVDVATGEMKRMRKHGSHIAGWAARKP
jgi:dipeptidyl aminopeptidase/acylaminoacyl peptidase